MDITAGIIGNIALLSILSIIITHSPFDRIKTRALRELCMGVLIGIIGIAIMLDPVKLMPGVSFDTRSILIATSSLFFGIVPSGVATLILLMWNAS